MIAIYCIANLKNVQLALSIFYAKIFSKSTSASLRPTLLQVSCHCIPRHNQLNWARTQTSRFRAQLTNHEPTTLTPLGFVNLI